LANALFSPVREDFIMGNRTNAATPVSNKRLRLISMHGTIRPGKSVMKRVFRTR
jgi:hypothetical protein